MLQIKPKQTPFPRRPAIDDDLLILRQSSTFELRHRLVLVDELMRVPLLHQPCPMKADRTWDVTFAEPNIVVADVFVVGSRIDDQNIRLVLDRENFFDVDGN